MKSSRPAVFFLPSGSPEGIFSALKSAFPCRMFTQGKTPQPDCRTVSPALFCEGKTAFSCRWFPAFPARRGFLPPYRIFTNLRQGNGLPPFAHSGFRPCRGFRNAPEAPALSAHAAGKRRNAAPAQPCRKVPAPSLKKTKRRKRPCRKSLAEHARILLPLRQVPFRRISVFSSITLMIAVSGSGAAGLRDARVSMPPHPVRSAPRSASFSAAGPARKTSERLFGKRQQYLACFFCPLHKKAAEKTGKHVEDAFSPEIFLYFCTSSGKYR